MRLFKTTTILLLLLCFSMPAQAQLLKKMKQRAEQSAERTILRKTDQTVSKTTEKTIDGAVGKKDKKEDKKKEPQQKEQAPQNRGEVDVVASENTALNKNTDAKRAFYREDVVITNYENGNQKVVQYFDADALALKVENQETGSPDYMDSEGFLYSQMDGEYVKGKIGIPGQGLFMHNMILEALRLPPEPFLANAQKQTDMDMEPNVFQGYVEFSSVYKPEDFRYEDFKESKQTLMGKTYTKFEFLNEPGYEGSYVLFDDKGRLVEIYTKVSKNVSTNLMDGFSMSPGENRLVYDYKPVDIKLPAAREDSSAKQHRLLAESSMGKVLGNKKSKDDIDEDDYDTSDQKGMIKSIRKSMRDHKVSMDDLPNSYDFDWQLATEAVMGDKKKDVAHMTFLIKPNATYQGAIMATKDTKDMGQMTMLFDMDLKTMVMFMDMQGRKIVQMYPIPDAGAGKQEDYKITELPKKTIIGYTCKGIQMENDRYVMKIYHAQDAPIKLPNFFNFGAQQNMELPDIDPKLIKQFLNGMILEMDLVDKKKSKNNANIIAKSLKNTPISLKKSEYTEMNFMSGAQMFKQ